MQSSACRQKCSPRAHCLCSRLSCRLCSALSFLALHREVSATALLFLHGPYICSLCGRVPCSAFSRLLWRCHCSGSALPVQWPACHFALWPPPRAMGHGAAQVPAAWHLGWPCSTPGRHETKLAPQRIVSTSLPGYRQASRRGRAAPARLTCQPGPWAGRRALHWRIAAQQGRGAAPALRLPGVRNAAPRWPAPGGSPRP